MPNDISNEPRDIIQIGTQQPRPYRTRLIHLPLGSPTATATLRFWLDGDMERCKLCRHCTGEDNFCFIGINRVVPRSEAAALSDHDCDWIAEPGALAAIIGKTS